MIVNPVSSSAHDVSASLAERAWRDVHSGSNVDLPPVAFEVVYEQNMADGARVLSRAINHLRWATHRALSGPAATCLGLGSRTKGVKCRV